MTTRVQQNQENQKDVPAIVEEKESTVEYVGPSPTDPYLARFRVKFGAHRLGSSVA